MERGFKVIRGLENEGIHLPKRKTKNAAGYDFEAMEDTVIHPGYEKPTLVKTGIKAYMQDDEVLYIFNRSSNPKKKKLVLANGVGVIDSDYYENPDNDGHIMFAYYNISDEDVVIKKGDAIGQGVFQKFLKVDEEEDITEDRKGGFGSTDNN